MCIFDYAIKNLCHKQTTENLLNFQLVCRSWNNPVQKLLYLIYQFHSRSKFIATHVAQDPEIEQVDI